MKAITVIENDDGSVHVAWSGTENLDETIELLHRGIDVTIRAEGWKLGRDNE